MTLPSVLGLLMQRRFHACSNQFMGAISASFFKTNGLNVFAKSDWLVDGPAGSALSTLAEVEETVRFGGGAFCFPKKLAKIDRDLFCASCSFFSFSAFAAFFSSLSFS